MNTPTDTTWIPLHGPKAILPGHDDLNTTQAIEFIRFDNEARCLMYNKQWFHAVDYTDWTHWRRVELPPLPARAQTQEEKDNLLFTERFGDHFERLPLTRSLKISFTEALRMERSHLGGLSSEQFVKELREISTHTKTGNWAGINTLREELIALLDRAEKG